MHHVRACASCAAHARPSHDPHLDGNKKALSVRMMARQHSERNRISLPRTLMVARCLPV